MCLHKWFPICIFITSGFYLLNIAFNKFNIKETLDRIMIWCCLLKAIFYSEEEDFYIPMSGLRCGSNSLKRIILLIWCWSVWIKSTWTQKKNLLALGYLLYCVWLCAFNRVNHILILKFYNKAKSFNKWRCFKEIKAPKSFINLLENNFLKR